MRDDIKMTRASTFSSQLMTRVKTVLVRPLVNICVFAAVLTVILPISKVNANAGFKIPQQIVSGYVLGRGIVPVDPDTGEGVYLVEYDDGGNEVGVVATLNDGLGEDILMGASEFNQILNSLQNYISINKEGIARGARVISKEAFNSGAYPEGAKTITNEAIPLKTLSDCQFPDAQSVLVKEKRQRFLKDACDLILKTMRIDASAQQTRLPDSIKSLWVDKSGRIKRQSAHRIGFRHGFYGQNGKPETSYPSGRVNFVNPQENEFYAPATGTPIRVGLSLGGLDLAIASANEIGRYAGSYPTTPCPGFSYSIQNQLTAEISYINLMPTGAPVHRFYMPRITYDSCSNYAAAACAAPTSLGAAGACSNAIGIEATAATPVNRISFLFDIMQFQGFAMLANKRGIVTQSESTTWHEPAGEVKKFTQGNFDLDGDRKFDKAQPGELKPIKDVYPDEQHDNPNKLVFIPVNDINKATHQGIFLSSVKESTDGQPQILKLIDQKRTDKSGIGLVKTLSKADFANTDIYIFRESNGELVLERRGVRDDKFRVKNVNANEVDAEKNAFGYRIKLRGNQDSRLNAGNDSRFDERNLGPGAEYAAWAARSKLEPKFQVRNADLLSPGETVRIVAINRSTGYVGTQRQVIYPGAQALYNIAETITMKPPLLRIWAERKYNVEKGITKDKERDYTIGQEGAATRNDTQIVIYTEWLDSDGSPLPSALGRNEGKDFGLTGRLQRVIGPNKLGQPAGSIYEFGIKPGLQTQVIELPGTGTAPGHLYVHVIGKAINQECIDNASVACANYEDNNPNPVYSGRPKYATPFYVPLANESSYLETLKKFNETRDKLIRLKKNSELKSLIKPKATHTWVQRPEYAFSVLDVAINEIKRTTNEEGGQKVVNISKQSTPLLSASDSLLEVLYQINAGGNVPLSAFDSAEQFKDRYQLVFGEEESSVTIDNTKQTIAFDNLEQLSQLTSDELLTLRLISNSDPQNVLWEWSFGRFDLLPGNSGDGNTIKITADDAFYNPPIIHGLLLDGDSTKPDTVKWLASGASTQPAAQVTTEGSFTTTLRLPTEAGSTALVKAVVNGENKSTFHTATYEVIPGIPKYIDVSSSGKTVVGGLGGIDLQLTVKDEFGNFVADGTPVEVIAENLKYSGNNTLIDGKTTITIAGVEDAGDALPVHFKVGAQEHTEYITVHDIELSIEDVPPVDVNGQQTITVNATSGFGELTGLELHLANLRGELSENFPIIQGNQVQVTYNAGQYRGMAQISAKLGTRVTSKQFFVKEPNGRPRLKSNVLVSDGAGSIDLGNGKYLEYSNETNLEVPGKVGEEVTVDLFSPHMPPLYPLLDYSAEQKQRSLASLGTNKIYDHSSGIDGNGIQAQRINIRSGQYRNAWHLPENAHIDVRKHRRLQNLTRAGAAFVLNVQQHPITDTVIAEISTMGLKLSLGADKRLRLDAGQGNILVSDPISLNQWYKVAFYNKGAELLLALDDKEYSENITQSPPIIDSNYAIRIGQPNVRQENGKLEFSVAGLKIYDLNNEVKVAFSNGKFDATATVDSNGFARIPLKAKPAVLAYQRFYEQKTLALRTFEAVFPSAYAANSQDFTACANSLDAVGNDENDPYIAAAEKMINSIIECVIKPKVEEAELKVKTADGVITKGLAVVNAIQYRTLYEGLKLQKDLSVAALNCIDGSVSGNNDTGIGAACDFITSLFLIGDIRDMYIQAFNSVWDPENYDSTVRTLAVLGTVTTLFVVTGAGTAVDGAISAAKIFVKQLRRLGPAGIKLKKLVSDYIDARVVSASSPAKGAAAIEIAGGFLQLGAFITLEGENLKPILNLMSDGIDSVTDMEVWFRFINKYANKAASLVAENNLTTPEQLLAFLVSSAHAGVGKLITPKYIVDLTDALKKAIKEPFDKKVGSLNGSTIGRAFTNTIKALEEGAANGAKTIDDFAFEDDTWRALMNAYDVGGEKALRDLRQFQGFNLGLGEGSYKFFLRTIGDFDLSKMDSNAAMQLERIFVGFQANFAKSQGSSHQLLDIITEVNAGKIIKEVEAPRRIKASNGEDISNRVYDYIIIDGNGVEVFVENKAWGALNFDQNLKRAMEWKPPKGVDANDVEIDDLIPGQLYTDIVEFSKNGFKGVQWRFDPRMAGQEGEIIKKMVDLVDENKKRFATHLGFLKKGKIDEVKWEEFIEETLPLELKKFVKIAEYGA